MNLSKFVCALALFGPTALNAAPPAEQARASGGGISASRLKPYSNAWMFSFVKDGVRKDQGIWSDVLRFREVDGKNLLERVQGMTYSNGLSSVTINRFDPATLEPVYSEQHTPDGKVVKRSFAGKHVELHLTKAAGAPEEVTVNDLKSDVFDFNGGMYGMLIAARPLRAGYSGTIPAVGEFDNNPVSIPFHVVRRETVEAGFKGRMDAWVVDVGGENPMTFWISDGPPYILRLELPMSGGTAMYDIIT